MSCSAIRGGGRPYVVGIGELEWDFSLVEEAEWKLVLESDFIDVPGNEHVLSLHLFLSLSLFVSLFVSLTVRITH